MTAKTNPVVFIHGLWLHATSWEPWHERFRNAGYATSAPGWPGEPPTVDDARAHPEAVAGRGVEEIAEHYRSTIAQLDTPPILVGHSFGGLIAQKLLGEGCAAAAIAIDSPQIKGVLRVPLWSVRAALPVLKKLGNRHGAVMLTADQFRLTFTNAVSQGESSRLHEQWVIPSPGRPIFEAATANFLRHAPTKVATKNADRGPLLLIAGGQDHAVPRSIGRSTLKLYRGSPAVTDFEEFVDRGHSLTIDSGWQDVADYCLAWLDKQSL